VKHDKGIWRIIQRVLQRDYLRACSPEAGSGTEDKGIMALHQSQLLQRHVFSPEAGPSAGRLGLVIAAAAVAVQCLPLLPRVRPRRRQPPDLQARRQRGFPPFSFMRLTCMMCLMSTGRALNSTGRQTFKYVAVRHANAHQVEVVIPKTASQFHCLPDQAKRQLHILWAYRGATVSRGVVRQRLQEGALADARRRAAGPGGTTPRRRRQPEGAACARCRRGAALAGHARPGAPRLARLLADDAQAALPVRMQRSSRFRSWKGQQ